MSFAPALPLGGAPGWALLRRIEPAQRAAFAARPDVARETAHFEAKAPMLASAAELVGDRRLLAVALGAFGLEDDIGKGALLRRVLESDPADPGGFAARMVDPRYRKLSEAFGFGAPGGPRIARPAVAGAVARAYRERAYEAALGESDPSLRLALNARRELAAYAALSDPEKAGWFSLLADRPVRRVVEGAYGLPESFGQLDLDRQRRELQDRTASRFGSRSLAAFSDPEAIDKLIRDFLAREAAAQGPAPGARGVAALSLLGGGLGAGGLQNLLLSRAASAPF